MRPPLDRLGRPRSLLKQFFYFGVLGNRWIVGQELDHRLEPMRVGGRPEQRVFRIALVRHAGELRKIQLRIEVSAAAPLSSVMNSRRLIRSPRRHARVAWQAHRARAPSRSSG